MTKIDRFLNALRAAGIKASIERNSYIRFWDVEDGMKAIVTFADPHEENEDKKLFDGCTLIVHAHTARPHAWQIAARDQLETRLLNDLWTAGIFAK